MTLTEVYSKLDAIGCLSFSTLHGPHIESRIAHFFACDDGGLYLRTMECKPFYRQLKEGGQMAVCGMYPQSQITHSEDTLPIFHPGYSIRLSGFVREFPLDQIKQKAEENRQFHVAVYDLEKYPLTRFFVLYKGHGEIYDYDYAMKNRDHKLLRIPFSFGGAPLMQAGLHIEETCIACGACFKACSYKAIVQGAPHHILRERCEECGNCLTVCPQDAIALREAY